MLSSEPLQPNEREMTQFIQIRDSETQENIRVFSPPPSYQLSEQRHQDCNWPFMMNS